MWEVVTGRALAGDGANLPPGVPHHVRGEFVGWLNPAVAPSAPLIGHERAVQRGGPGGRYEVHSAQFVSRAVASEAAVPGGHAADGRAGVAGGQPLNGRTVRHPRWADRVLFVGALFALLVAVAAGGAVVAWLLMGGGR